MTSKKKRREEDFVRPSPAHARTHKGLKLSRVLALALVAVLGLGASMAAAVQWRIDSAVTKIDPVKYVAKPAEPKDPRAGESLNILVMGTDSRAGNNSDLVGDHVGGERSDTTMIVHISSDRSRVEVISIPRDSMVEIPSCQVGENESIPATYGLFNQAFARGWDNGGTYEFAAACTMSTVQHLTGLTIDHTVIVNFEGFVGMVDALGGIEIDVPETLYSPKASNLCLVKGEQTLEGETALQLVRARTGTGWGLEIGSDLKRIERQQAVLTATVATALNTNMVTDLGKLTGFVTASLESLTVDSKLNANALVGLAWKLKDLRLDDVQFYGTPVMDDPADPNRVVWTAEATEYWNKLKLDQPITDAAAEETEPSGDVSASDKESSTSKDSSSPSESSSAKPEKTSSSASPSNEPTEHKKAPAPTKTEAASYAECIS